MLLSKPPPQSNSSLEAVEPDQEKGVITFFCYCFILFFQAVVFFNPTTVFWAVVRGTGSLIKC